MASTFPTFSSILPLAIPFRYWNKNKSSQIYNNLQGLQKVIVKDFSWNMIPWNAYTFWENTKTIYKFLSLTKNYAISEKAVSHNAVYYQQLTVAQYQVNVLC